MYETMQIPAIGPMRPYRPDAGVLWYRWIFGGFLAIAGMAMLLILRAGLGA